MTVTLSISRKQLVVLFLGSLFVIMYAGPLIRLLPIYVSLMGGSSTQAGLYMALAYAGLAAGTLVAGWLSDRYEHKKAVVVIAGIIASMSLWLMSLSTNLILLSLATVSAWFFGGITFSFFTILAGLSAGDEERGRVFGLMAMTLPLASVLAAPVAGYVADHQGYPALLAGYALFALSIPALSLLIENPASSEAADDAATEGAEPTKRHWRSLGLQLLAAATLIMAFVNFANGLGLSLSMHANAFSSAQIANASAIGALVSIPVIYIVGRLSDSLSPKFIIASIYIAVGVGTLTLATASLLWQFWIASILVAIMTAAMSVGNALTRDLLPKSVLGRGLASINTARWIGAILGFALAGIAIEAMGVRNTYLILLMLIPLSIVLILSIRPSANTL